MVEREKIKKLVKEVVYKDKLQSCFIPIIEEFFFRVADQLDWDDEELNKAIIRYEKLLNKYGIKFAENITGRHTIYTNTKTSDIFFDSDYLRFILEFDKKNIEKFINIAMHEQGHLIQMQDKNEINTGFIDTEISKKCANHTRDEIINEFAETINATRLQKGNIESGRYLGYENIQSAGKIAISSLGISELELANLQFEQDAREKYKELIASRLGGIPSGAYRDSFGEILDAIYKFSVDLKQRKNFIFQVYSLQALSKDLFEKRFYDIIKNSDNTMKDFARLCIDQGEKEKALTKLFYEFNIKEWELQIKTNRNPYSMLAEQGYDLKELKKFYDIECEERRKIQEQKDKQCKKIYDNEELIEKIYQSFLKYPIRKVPLKDIHGVILSKNNGKKKRKALRQEKLLTESNIINCDKHADFVNKISDIKEYKENDIIEQDNWTKEIKKERDNENEGSREN